MRACIALSRVTAQPDSHGPPVSTGSSAPLPQGLWAARQWLRESEFVVHISQRSQTRGQQPASDGAAAGFARRQRQQPAGV